jgi:hypothetical protein
MADYRDWCGSCHKEINFGSHDPDCDYLHAERIARKELNEFNDALYKEYAGKSADEVIEEAIELHQEINALSALLRGKQKKWDFLRYELMDKRAIETFRERTGRRYI